MAALEITTPPGHEANRQAAPPSRAIYALWFAGAFVYLYLRTFLLPNIPFVGTGDQILFFSRAARMIHGQVLYRDFFELVTPGTEFLYAAAFYVFGVHAWVIQAWAVVVGLAFASVLTWLASKILSGTMILLPSLFFLAFNFSSALDLTHHWYSTLAALVAVAILMEDMSLWRLLAAGAICSIATLFTQTQGALTFVALVSYLLWLKRSGSDGPSTLTQLAVLALPYICVLSGVLGYYIYKAGFQTVFFDLVIFPVRFLSSGEVNSPRTYLHQIPAIRTPAEIGRLVPFVFIYTLVPYVYFVGLYRIWRKRVIIPALLLQRLILLHLVGLALFLSVASGPRFFRLSTVAPPAILICTWILEGQRPGYRMARILLSSLAVIFAFIVPARRQTHWHTALNLPIGRTAFSDVLMFQEFQWMSERTHPSESFFNNSALCLYLGLNNPTAVEFVTYGDFTRPDQVDAVIQSLQRNPARYIVLLPQRMASAKMHDHAEPFRTYVRDHYRLARIFNLDYSAQYQQEVWESNRTQPTK